MKSLLDKDFKYTPARATDANYLRDKFMAIRLEQAKAKADTAQKVAALKPPRSKQHS